MADAKSYSARDLIEMARIPPEAWERLGKELPAMLGIIAPIVAIYDLAEAPKEAYDSLLTKMIWNDDGETHVDVSIKTHEGKNVFTGRVG